MKPPHSSLGEAIRAASSLKAQQESQNASKPANQKDGLLASQPDMVNLSIKVSKADRIHWLVEAKKQGTSLTEAIIDALKARFGNPV